MEQLQGKQIKNITAYKGGVIIQTTDDELFVVTYLESKINTGPDAGTYIKTKIEKLSKNTDIANFISSL